MCFKKKGEPVRLAKKEPSTIRVWYDFIKSCAKEPEFWLLLGLSAILVILIILAIREAAMYFVYNRGGIIV